MRVKTKDRERWWVTEWRRNRRNECEKKPCVRIRPVGRVREFCNRFSFSDRQHFNMLSSLLCLSELQIYSTKKIQTYDLIISCGFRIFSSSFRRYLVILDRNHSSKCTTQWMTNARNKNRLPNLWYVIVHSNYLIILCYGYDCVKISGGLNFTPNDWNKKHTHKINNIQ